MANMFRGSFKDHIKGDMKDTLKPSLKPHKQLKSKVTRDWDFAVGNTYIDKQNAKQEKDYQAATASNAADVYRPRKRSLLEDNATNRKLGTTL